jgi:hypothetical protein
MEEDMYKARMLLAVGAIGVIAAGGSAFTDAVSFAKPSQVVGYGTQTVTGANAQSVTYNLNATGDNIDTVTLLIGSDIHTGYTVRSAFNSDSLSGCTVGAFAAGATTVTCDNGGTTFTQSPETATAYHVSVVQAP